MGGDAPLLSFECRPVGHLFVTLHAPSGLIALYGLTHALNVLACPLHGVARCHRTNK
jgi:hypothetical protein